MIWLWPILAEEYPREVPPAPRCEIPCQRCKAVIDVDFEWIRTAAIYDIDCDDCGNLNTYTSKAAVRRLDTFRNRCVAFEAKMERGFTARSSIGPRLRWQVLRRDGFKCRYCGATASEAELHVDHATSKADGGTDHIDNLVTACIPCNLGKGRDSE